MRGDGPLRASAVMTENDNAVPAEAKLQLGNMFSPSLGVYMDGLIGNGGDKPYEWGVGVGVRFDY